MRRWLLSVFAVICMTACTSKKEAPADPPKPSYETCQADHFTCASIDIEDPKAAEAYKIGCEKKDYYSCFRLGQFHELKAKNLDEALQAYSSACAGKDFYGCRSEEKLRTKLCLEEKQKKHCRNEP